MRDSVYLIKDWYKLLSNNIIENRMIDSESSLIIEMIKENCDCFNPTLMFLMGMNYERNKGKYTDKC